MRPRLEVTGEEFDASCESFPAFISGTNELEVDRTDWRVWQ